MRVRTIRRFIFIDFSVRIIRSTITDILIINTGPLYDRMLRVLYRDSLTLIFQFALKPWSCKFCSMNRMRRNVGLVQVLFPCVQRGAARWRGWRRAARTRSACAARRARARARRRCGPSTWPLARRRARRRTRSPPRYACRLRLRLRRVLPRTLIDRIKGKVLI